jgi:hypothetical protein
MDVQELVSHIKLRVCLCLQTVLRWGMRGTDARDPDDDTDPETYPHSSCAVHGVYVGWVTSCTVQHNLSIRLTLQLN